MALKSFPTKTSERELIWCLEASAIDKALKHEKSRELMQEPNITVVQLPLSRLAKNKSEVLAKLDQQELLSHNQFLMLGDNDVLEKTYFKVDDIIKDFLDAVLHKASSYQRFFAILGASSIHFESQNYDSSNSEAGLNAELGGLAAKITGVNAEIAIQATKVLKQMIQMSSEYEKQEMPDLERISKAERVLKECCLENDQICKNALATLKDGSKPIKLNLEIAQSMTESRNLKALVNLRAKIPVSTGSDEFNLAYLQGAINIESTVDRSLKVNIVIAF